MISVKIIADSKNAYNESRVTTFELEYPRFIHSEIMTHREFSRNAQSSRAVPVDKTLEVNQEIVTPLVWGKNKSGMSSTEVLEGNELENAKYWWGSAGHWAKIFSKNLNQAGLHKQWANRITEPFSKIKVVLTSTDRGLQNFFWLRRDPDAAQPEIVELADQMYEAYNNSVPRILQTGDWHMPYVERGEHSDFVDDEGVPLTTEEALHISASCCAQVSYRKLNTSKEKAIDIYNRLFSGPKPHLSPTEHQAKCIDHPYMSYGVLEKGVTHIDRYGNFWSGNLQGFIQYRQLIG